MAIKLKKLTYHCKLPTQKSITLLDHPKIKSFYNLVKKKN